MCGLQEVVENSSVGSFERVCALNLNEFRGLGKAVVIRLLEKCQ